MFNSAIAGLTLRQSLAGRRWMIVAVLAALPVILTLVLRAYASDDEDLVTGVTQVLQTLSLTIVIPVIALILASSGFGAEVDDGTVVYMLTKPISRVEIVLSKLIVTAAICIAINVTSVWLTAMAGMRGIDTTHLTRGFVAGTALGSLLYTAMFLALGLITRRGMLVGLVYLVVWEGTIANFFPGMRSLSIRQYMFVVTDALSTADPSEYLSQVAHGTAYQMSAIVGIGAVALAIYRLRNFQVGQSA